MTVCVDMHPVNGASGIYDTQQYLEHINKSINFDRLIKCLSYCGFK